MSTLKYLFCGAALVAILPGAAEAACSLSPAITRTPTIGSPFATGNRDVTLLSEQTSDNVRITGGCIDVQDLNINGIGSSTGDLTRSATLPAGTYPPDDPSDYFISGWYGGFSGKIWQMLRGSVDSPITAGGPMIALGQTQAIPSTNCSNNTANTGCNSTLLIQTVGTPASTMTTNGLTVYAETQSTLGGDGLTAAQAGNFVGVSSGGSTARGTGIFADGIRYSTSGKTNGAEISGTNDTDTDCGAASAIQISQCNALSVAARGPYFGSTIRRISAGIQLLPGNSNGGMRSGIVVTQDTVSEITFADYGSATTALFIAGTHTYGLKSTDTSGYYGFGTQTPTARVNIGGDISATNWSGGGIGLRADATTYTCTDCSGTVAFTAPYSFLAPTLAASSATTYTIATTLSVSPPVAGSNVTATNLYSAYFVGGVLLNDRIVLKNYTVATLPTCNAANKYAVVAVSDASAPTFNATVVGGGATPRSVMCDGTNWKL